MADETKNQEPDDSEPTPERQAELRAAMRRTWRRTAHRLPPLPFGRGGVRNQVLRSTL